METYIPIHENRDTGILLTFKHANPKSDYVRILQLCSSKPTTLHEIYPNTKAPLAGEVVALAKQGYLQKYTTEKHIHNTPRRISFWRPTNHWYSKVWYQTTEKGKKLVKDILSSN